MQVECVNCHIIYKFSARWRGNADNYICRSCKIRRTTRSKEFREGQRQKSLAALSDPNIKSRMSQRATMNNIHNAEKISKTLVKYYENEDLRQMISNRTKSYWLDKKYAETVRNKISNRWQDPIYRGRILGSRSHLRRRRHKVVRKLKEAGLEYTPDFALGLYLFDFKIQPNILFDEKLSEEKRIFLSHYFPEYKYISDLTEAAKLGS